MDVSRVGEGIRAILPSSMQKHTIVGELPSLKTEGIALIIYDGNFSTEYFGKKSSGATSIFNPVLKCLIRHSSYDTAATWIEELKETLHRYSDDNFLSILLAGTPAFLGRTPEKLCEFQITFNIQLKE